MTRRRIVHIGILALTLAGGVLYLAYPNANAHAATSGQMTLYLHRENSAASTTYNALTLSPPSPTTLTTSANVTALVTPAAPCESAQTTGNAINSISVDDDSTPPGTGDNCLATFFSSPVGQTITVETTDTDALYGEIYGSNTPGDTANTNVIMRVYKYDGTTFTQFGAVTLGDFGTGVTDQRVTAAATPSSAVTLNAGDRIVVALSLNVIAFDGSGGADVTRVEFGATPAPSFLRLSYTAITPSKPELTGADDDDFTTSSGVDGWTDCANAGTTYNTKWTCTTPSGTTLGQFNAAATSSEWLILRDKEGATLGTNFGASPENTYIYQTVDTNADGEGTLSTVLNSAIDASGGTTPYFHSGLLLWTSNTDYLVIEAAFDGTNRGVMVNNSGTLSNSTALSEYNRLWLRWDKTGTSYQAQYSTDGTTYTNIGSSVSHATTFTRAGLTSYAAAINTEYAAAFEWFDYALAPRFTQSAYRFFANTDATDVGAALAAQDTAVSATTAGQIFRMRALVHASGQVNTSGQSFKLQFVGKGSGSCASPSGGTPATYTDVTASTAIAFRNNTTPADGATLTANANDPVHGADAIVNQTYEEANNFTNSVSAISPSQDGKWDFALYDNGAPQNTTYCFRAVKSDDTALYAYDMYPEFTTFGAVTLTSAANQSFEIGQSAAAISTVTITALSGTAITAANDLRIAIATSTVDMRFDTSDTSATFGGTASGKVSGPVSYEGGGSVLVIPVNTDFVASETLTIAGLSFANFNAVVAPASGMVLYLDGPADVTADATTNKLIAIRGTETLANHASGQESNKLNVDSTSVSSAELFAFRLTPNGESINVTQLVASITNLKGYKCSDLTNVGLYIDYSADGTVNGTDATIGGTPACEVNGVAGTGSFTFSTAFATSTSRNYILRMDVASNNPGDRMTFSLPTSGLTAVGTVSLEAITPAGSITAAVHFRDSGQGSGGNDETPTETPTTGGTNPGGGTEDLPPPLETPSTGGGGSGGGEESP